MIQKEIEKFVKSCSKEKITGKDINKKANSFINYIAQQAVSFAFKNYMDLYKTRHGNIPEDKRNLVRENILLAVKKDVSGIKGWSSNLTNFVLKGGVDQKNGHKVLYAFTSKMFLYFYIKGTHQANLLFIGPSRNNLFDKPMNLKELREER